MNGDGENWLVAWTVANSDEKGKNWLGITGGGVWMRGTEYALLGSCLGNCIVFICSGSVCALICSSSVTSSRCALWL